MSRKRNYIPLPEKLAATLACLLPQADRDDLRNRKVPASAIIALFQFDHLALHSSGGDDGWHNLHPLLVAEHREKSKRDTSIAAKAKRIDKKWLEFTSVTLTKPKLPDKKHRWPKQKLQSRGFR